MQEVIIQIGEGAYGGANGGVRGAMRTCQYNGLGVIKAAVTGAANSGGGAGGGGGACYQAVHVLTVIPASGGSGFAIVKRRC